MEALANFAKYTNALILREIRIRMGSNPLSLLWVVTEPILNVMIFISIKLVLGITAVNNIDNVLFVVSGIVPFFAFQYAMVKVLYAARSNASLLSFPKIKTLHGIMARLILEYGIMLIVFVLLLSIAYWAGHTFHIKDLLMVMYNYTLCVLFGAGIGLIFSPIIGRFHFMDTFLTLYRRILFFTSGVFFAVDSVPLEIQKIIALNPLVHTLALLRSNLFENYVGNEIFQNDFYATGCVALTLFFGLIMIRKYENWAYETPS